MKKMTKTSSGNQTGDAGTPEILAPFSTFSTLMTVYSGSDAAQQLRARWVGAMPPIGLGDWAVVLSADPASQPQPPRDPGLYVNYANRWVLAAPYDAMCDYSARGLEFDVYLDVSKVQAVPAGAVVYHNGDPEAKTTIPAGAGLYAAVTLDDVARQRETSLTAADPTAKLGLTAVKGTSKSFMRADAAPPLDQTIAPTWSGAHTFSGASPAIAKDQTVAANEPAPNQLITRAYAEKNFKGGGASGADPTAKLGLTAVKGASASFMRADAAPALDQSITPTWGGAHLFRYYRKRMVKLADEVKSGSGTTARTDLNDVNTPYIGIGGAEWGTAVNYVIGYGYTDETGSYPVLAGAQEVSSSGLTNSAFIVATRNGPKATDAPAVRFKVTPDGRPEITNDQTASGYTPAANELVTRAYVEAKIKGGGASGADPMAKLGLSAVKGTSTSFMRADAAPALDQSIAPTWSGVHNFMDPNKRMARFADLLSKEDLSKRVDLDHLDTPYVGIGGREYGTKDAPTYNLIGYGFTNDYTESYPVLIGSENTGNYNDSAAFVVATRNSYTGKRTVKLRIGADGRPEITNDQTASGYTPAANELITRAYAEAKFKSGGASGADPTAKLGLTAVKGTSTSFMRADAAPALDQSIAPTWSGLHTFSGVSPAIANDQTNKAYEPGAKQLITRAYFESRYRQPTTRRLPESDPFGCLIDHMENGYTYVAGGPGYTGANSVALSIPVENLDFDGAFIKVVNNTSEAIRIFTSGPPLPFYFAGSVLTNYSKNLAAGQSIYITQFYDGKNAYFVIDGPLY